MKKNIDFDYIKSELKKIQKYFLAQKFEKVIEKTTNLMKKSPNQVPYYNYIGLSHRQLGRNHDAETIFKKGLEIFPDNLTIICNLGALYRLMARFEEADYFLKKGLEIKEDDFNPSQAIYPKYFGVANTKLYIEKMCEFFSKIRLIIANGTNPALIIFLGNPGLSAFTIDFP